MNILIDTNIFIPLETQNELFCEPDTHLTNQLYKNAKKLQYHIFLLDTQKKDLLNDKNEQRRKEHLIAFEKYEILEKIEITELIKKEFPIGGLNSHDIIDVSLLNALCVNAVDILVTNDEGIHKKAKKVNLDDKVYYLSETINFINGQLPRELSVETEHPIIKNDKCFNLYLKDQLFDSLRKSYKGFDEWFKKCQKEHRDCLTIKQNEKLVGVCIYKFEDACYGMTGNILKICTFKLSISGTKLGELLLKNLFDCCYNSNVDWVYVTVFSDNYICHFFETFGFQLYREKKEDTGELIYRKRVNPKMTDVSTMGALDYHILFGPKYFNQARNAFIVPIKPSYHQMLFPEAISNSYLFPELNYTYSYSNAIRKAYICKSNTTKLKIGDILFFYISGESIIKCCGIIENIFICKTPEEIISKTGKITVYNKEDIIEQCKDNKKRLIIIFRQTNSLLKGIPIKSMLKNNLMKGYPQSITLISEEAKKWIIQQKQF